jgi:hypothetical protein
MRLRCIAAIVGLEAQQREETIKIRDLRVMLSGGSASKEGVAPKRSNSPQQLASG